MHLKEREETIKSLEYDFEQVGGLLPYKTVKPAGTASWHVESHSGA